MDAQTGAEAVQLSKRQIAQQAVVSVDDEVLRIDTMQTQIIANKTFYQQNNGFWQDAEFKPESKLPEVTVQFGSEEYFDLITKEKELAQFFALGEQVVVVYKGKVYRVTK